MQKKKGSYEPETGKTVTWGVGVVNKYYDALREIVNDDNLENNVGAALGGGLENTKKLCPMKYNKAISGPDGEA